MPLVENTTTDNDISRKTEKRFILFTDPKLEVGFLSLSNFGVQKLLYTDNENFFGFQSMGSHLEFKKTKHAYIYSTSDYAMDADTILNLCDIKDLSLTEKQKEIYVLPVIQDKDAELDHILEKEGIDNILSWFENDDPFLNIFNKIHLSLGNNPKDFIY
jgi:hypothetical protein